MVLTLYVKKKLIEEAIDKFRFRECRKPYVMLHYLRTRGNKQVIFIFPTGEIKIENLEKNDLRIYKNNSIKYQPIEDSQDILYDMIVSGYVEKK